MIDAVIGDIDERDAAVKRHDADHDVRVRRVRRRGRVNRQQPGRDRQHPARRRCGSRRSARSSRGVKRRDDDHDRRHRQQAQRRGERAVAEHELEVLRDEEHHAVHREEHEDHAAGAGAERRVAEVVHVEHRLVDVQLPGHEQRRARRRRSRTRSSVAALAQPLLGRLDEAVHERDDPDDREHRADRVEARLLGIASTSGTRNFPATSATTMIGTLTRNTEPYQKCPSSQPLATGPIAPAAPVTLAQIAIAFVRSCAREDVDEDRQRRRHDERGRRAHQRRGTRSAATSRSTRSRAPRRTRKQHEPDLQRALAPEAVAERAGREQQARRTRASRSRRPTAAATRSRAVRATASGSRRSGSSCRRRRSAGSGTGPRASTSAGRRVRIRWDEQPEETFRFDTLIGAKLPVATERFPPHDRAHCPASPGVRSTASASARCSFPAPASSGRRATAPPRSTCCAGPWRSASITSTPPSTTGLTSRTS